MSTITPSAGALAAELIALADEYAEASAADARHYAPGRKAAARVNLQVEIARLASLKAEPKAQAQAAALERLTLWARNMVGRCECTGDHPIADAERTLGWRK